MKRQVQGKIKEQLDSFYKSCPEYFIRLKEEGWRSKLRESRLRQTVDLLGKGDIYLDVGCGAGVLVNYAIQEEKVYAVSWIWSESLYNYLTKKGCEVTEYDTYRYLKDTLVIKKDSFLNRLKIRVFNLLSKTPFLKHLGTCIFIIARKEK